ncbi:MAG: glycosyltransferase family 2 protein [Patescibacteria group bacterium]|nr:glycosyltransferase family 2 protein [Patescibacteria group bacterium]
MTKPTISLIIPAYNEEKYIGECLEYITKNSNGKFFEIIVVSNASTDRTVEVASKYPGVKVVNENRKGVMWARERGRLEAKGEILAFIDADNHMPSGWIEKIEKEFSNNDKLVCLSGPYIYYDIPKWQTFLVAVYWYVFTFPIYLILRYIVVGGNFAIKKDTLEKMNGFDTSIDFYGDDTSIARSAHNFGTVLFRTNFFMYASGRRFSKKGLFLTGLIYAVNFFSQVFMKKSVTSTHEDIR